MRWNVKKWDNEEWDIEWEKKWNMRIYKYSFSFIKELIEKMKFFVKEFNKKVWKNHDLIEYRWNLMSFLFKFLLSYNWKLNEMRK